MSDEIIDAAVCLWEACLDDGFSHYQRYRENYGAAETRDRVVSFARQCHESWYFAHIELGFDDPFDWEWCPRFMTLCVDEDFTLKFSDPESAAAAIMKDYE